MSLKIVVLAKQVPDTRNVGPDAMTPEGTVNRSALPAIFNPEDLNALDTFAPDRSATDIIRKISREYSWFNRNDEYKTYAYVTAKIYKGVFIPTAIYFNGIEVITITNE